MSLKHSTVFTLAISLALMFCPLKTHASTVLVPEAVKQAIHQFEPQARIREDAFVRFANGAEYLLIAPETPVQTNTVTVQQQVPTGAGTPDLIMLTDGHYLLRIVQLPNGRKSLPILNDVPFELKSGLLPQQFRFPQGFLIPTMWKSLTGNLLTDDAESNTAAKQAISPLLLSNVERNTLQFWDVTQGQVSKEVSLPCKPGNMAVASEGNHIVLSCQGQPQLLIFTPETSTLRTVTLPKPAMHVVLDPNQPRALVLDGSNKIGIVNLQNAELGQPVVLKGIPSALTISRFRNRAYVALQRHQVIKNPHIGRKYRHEARRTVTEEIISRLAWLDMKTLTVEKETAALANVSDLFIQDDKSLWMISKANKTAQTFDLRWQEYGSDITLPEEPIAWSTEGDWIYWLLPTRNEIARLNSQTLVWEKSIPLDPQRQPKHLLVDRLSHQLIVLGQQSSGLEVIDLDRQEWIGTQTLGNDTLSQAQWLVPPMDKPEQLVRIKFQDGRLLLQNAQVPQSATSSSGRHDQPKAPTP